MRSSRQPRPSPPQDAPKNPRSDANVFQKAPLSPTRSPDCRATWAGSQRTVNLLNGHRCMERNQKPQPPLPLPRRPKQAAKLCFLRINLPMLEVANRIAPSHMMPTQPHMETAQKGRRPDDITFVSRSKEER